MAEPLPDTTFTRMVDATRDDYQLIARHTLQFFQGLPERVLTHLRLLEGDTAGYAVDRLTHSLQSAARAERAGEDEEYVVCALLHDIGDTLGSANHADVGAAILEPFVSEANHWMVKHHAIFQGYNFFHHIGLDRDMRDRFKGSEHYDRTEAFIAKYDDPAFDADKALLSLDPFVPMVRSVFSTPKKTIYSGFIDD